MVQPEQWRVFCAIDCTAEIREKVSAHIERLRKSVPEAHASWSKPDNIHLTVKFLGDIPQSRVGSLSTAADRAVEGLESFRISVQGSGVFPSRRQPRVLWIGIEDLEGKLGELYRRLEKASAEAGFSKEARAFHPHLTLARLRKPEGASMLAKAHKQMQFERCEFTISELLVIRSELSSEGARYAILSRHTFQCDFTNT